MRLKNIAFLILGLIIFSSCSKEETYEMITKELEQFMDDNEIERVVALDPDESWSSINKSAASDYALDYKFEEQFIRVARFSVDSYYNLEKLVRYEKRQSGETKFLVLYFY